MFGVSMGRVKFVPHPVLNSDRANYMNSNLSLESKEPDNVQVWLRLSQSETGPGLPKVISSL